VLARVVADRRHCCCRVPKRHLSRLFGAVQAWPCRGRYLQSSKRESRMDEGRRASMRRRPKIGIALFFGELVGRSINIVRHKRCRNDVLSVYYIASHVVAFVFSMSPGCLRPSSCCSKCPSSPTLRPGSGRGETLCGSLASSTGPRRLPKCWPSWPTFSDRMKLPIRSATSSLAYVRKIESSVD